MRGLELVTELLHESGYGAKLEDLAQDLVQYRGASRESRDEATTVDRDMI